MTERKTGANTGFASGGVTCPALAGELCASIQVQCWLIPKVFGILRNPPERKARKRCQPCAK
jgi:hypothetical protein